MAVNTREKETAKKEVTREVMAFNLNNLERPNILNSYGAVSECYVNEALENLTELLVCPHCQMTRYHAVINLLESAGVSEQRMRALVAQDTFDMKAFNEEMKTYKALNTGVNELLCV